MNDVSYMDLSKATIIKSENPVTTEEENSEEEEKACVNSNNDNKNNFNLEIG